MSAALESLMRDPPRMKPADQSRGGIVFFILIGGGAALCYVLVSTIMVGLLSSVDAWIVSSACYAGFVVPVYLLHRRFTFASEASHWQALPRYAAVQMMAVLLATLFGYILHGTLALPSLPAAVLVTALTSGINFVVLKSWAFAFERSYETASA